MAKQTVYAYKVKDKDGNTAQIYFSKAQVPGKWNESDMLEAKEVVKDNVESMSSGKGVYYLRSALDKSEKAELVGQNQKGVTVKRIAQALQILEGAVQSAKQAAISETEATELYTALANTVNALNSAMTATKVKKATGAKAPAIARFAHLFTR